MSVFGSCALDLASVSSLESISREVNDLEKEARKKLKTIAEAKKTISMVNV